VKKFPYALLEAQKSVDNYHAINFQQVEILDRQVWKWIVLVSPALMVCTLKKGHGVKETRLVSYCKFYLICVI